MLDVERRKETIGDALFGSRRGQVTQYWQKKGENLMNSDQSFDNLAYEDQMHLAERELAAFIRAVKQLFGAESALLSAEDWLDESQLMDSPPHATSRDWQAVTVAASARLANRVNAARDHRTPAVSTDPKASPIPSSNCAGSALLV